MELPSPPSTDPITPAPSLSPEELKALTGSVQRHRRRWDEAINAIFYGSFYIVIISALASIGIGYPIAIGGGMTAFFSFVMIYHWAKFDAWKCRKATVPLLQFLTDTQDAAMLGPILDFQDTCGLPGESENPIRPSIDAAVLRLLPLITSAHSGALNTLHRSRLHNYWHYSPSGTYNFTLENPLYLHGLIHAFEQIGDKRDLSEIESWLRVVYRELESPALTQHPFERRMDAAMREKYRKLAASLQHCLDVVTERAAREEGKDFLLRPDRKPETGEALLRSATDSAERSPEQLLRPSDDSGPPY